MKFTQNVQACADASIELEQINASMQGRPWLVCPLQFDLNGILSGQIAIVGIHPAGGFQKQGESAMPRDRSGNAAKKSEDRQKRKPPPKVDPKAPERERNVRPAQGKSEEHSRVPKGNRG